ncbi:hypothetical protein O6H91_19G076100 [Diphasiastrum complanatum]|uniref:Uncharacterized protein n=1 Tax=Diphasiastrum complanatum TaxID=34168 RepID=A0ACC2AXI3_DIPCM|nr:hypothetical protein O6H91_19G076100 [Diphasiastrum complanatum]
MSPFELNYGFQPTSPTTLGIPRKVPSVVEFLTQMQAKLDLACQSLSKAQAKAETYARENRSYREVERGDMVFLPKSKVI